MTTLENAAHNVALFREDRPEEETLEPWFGSTDRVASAKLDWDAEPGETCDFVVGADLVYHEAVVDKLVRTVVRLQAKEFWSGNLTLQQTLFSATALPLLRGAYALTDAARLEEDIEGQRIRAGVARAHYALATNFLDLAVSIRDNPMPREELGRNRTTVN